MRPRSLALGALPFTFFIYVLEALLATFSALPLGIELSRLLGASSWDATQTALLVSSGPVLWSGLRVTAGSAALSLGLLLLLSPWLQMSWLSALYDPRPTPVVLVRGARLILRACWVSLLVGAFAALASAPFLLAAYYVHRGLMHSTDARFHDLALLGTLAPVLWIALLAQLVIDLARASALRLGGWWSVRAGLRSALRPSIQLRALTLCSLGYGMVLLASFVSSRAAELPGRVLLTVTALQSALLARAFFRSWWLASALTCMEPSYEPLASEV
jgi:hypothetical protein